MVGCIAREILFYLLFLCSFTINFTKFVQEPKFDTEVDGGLDFDWLDINKSILEYLQAFT